MSDAASDGPRGSHAPRRVVVAGGGVAALEAVLALRVHAGDLVDIHVLAPGDSFLYQPVSVTEAFDVGEAREFDLPTILDDQHAHRHVDSLASVDPRARTVRTGAGDALAYDELLVALGAHPTAAVPGALTFRGRRDVAALREIVRELDRGQISRVAFVAPGGNAWPLPVYELAVLAATHALAERLAAEILLVSGEDAPLELFGPAASAAVSALLDARGVGRVLGTHPVSFADGLLRLAGGGVLPVDRAVALPLLEGPAIEGLPHDDDGFIPVDVYARVQGLDGVYAAGDATSFPLKQGGLATQQADAAAEVIAERAGAPVHPRPFAPVIRGLLLTGGVPIYLRAGPGAPRREASIAGDRGPDDRPRAAGRLTESSASSSALWWPPSKIAGRYLAPYLATARPPSLGAAPLADRAAVATRWPVSEAEHADALDLALLLADNDARLGDYTMALHALDSAEALAGALPHEYLAKRERWQRATGATPTR